MDRARRVVGIDYGIENYAIPQEKGLIKDRSTVKKGRVQDKDKQVQGLFKYFCAALICLALLLGQCVYINSQGVEIGKLNGMIDEYKLNNDKSLIRISNLSSLEYIEKTAINEYNMMRPDKIQYLRR